MTHAQCPGNLSYTQSVALPDSREEIPSLSIYTFSAHSFLPCLTTGQLRLHSWAHFLGLHLSVLTMANLVLPSDEDMMKFLHRRSTRRAQKKIRFSPVCFSETLSRKKKDRKLHAQNPQKPINDFPWNNEISCSEILSMSVPSLQSPDSNLPPQAPRSYLQKWQKSFKIELLDTSDFVDTGKGSPSASTMARRLKGKAKKETKAEKKARRAKNQYVFFVHTQFILENSALYYTHGQISQSHRKIYWHKYIEIYLTDLWWHDTPIPHLDWPSSE